MRRFFFVPAILICLNVLSLHAQEPKPPAGHYLFAWVGIVPDKVGTSSRSLMPIRLRPTMATSSLPS